MVSLMISIPKNVLTFQCVLLRVRFCFEVQVLCLCFALAILIILAVGPRVLLGRVPGLLLALVCFRAAAAGDAVGVETISKWQWCAVGVTQRIAAVAGAQDIGVHRAGAAVIVGIRIGPFLRSELVLGLWKVQVLEVTVVRTLLALADAGRLLLLLLERKVLQLFSALVQYRLYTLVATFSPVERVLRVIARFGAAGSVAYRLFWEGHEKSDCVTVPIQKLP